MDDDGIKVVIDMFVLLQEILLTSEVIGWKVFIDSVVMFDLIWRSFSDTEYVSLNNDWWSKELLITFEEEKQTQ